MELNKFFTDLIDAFDKVVERACGPWRWEGVNP
jgi:hypothetical protein